MNEGDFQVRAAYKILGYNPIQKSFSTPKYVIKAKDPRLHRITVAEHDFLLPEGSSAQGGCYVGRLLFVSTSRRDQGSKGRRQRASH